MTIEEWLGEENQLGMDIWTKKYCGEGEDFESLAVPDQRGQ